PCCTSICPDHPPPPAIPTVPLHDALPISWSSPPADEYVLPLEREPREPEDCEIEHDQDDRHLQKCAVVEHDAARHLGDPEADDRDRKSTRLNSSHGSISYAVFCLKKKRNK